MEVSPPIETVYEAIYALYNQGNNPSEKQQASNWLNEMQKSVFAWKIADELLARKVDKNSCYLAAQTMRSKLQNSFHELPQDSHASLRDALLNHLSKLDDSTECEIATQLCVALAHLALQMGSWKNAAVDIASRYNSLKTCFILELLTVLPEEVNSRTLRLGANRRSEIYTEFSENLSSVNQLLEMCLMSEPNNERVKIRTYKCFASWLNIRSISLSQVWNSSVLSNAFNVLCCCDGSNMVQEAAADAVIAFLQTLDDNNNQDEIQAEILNSVGRLEQAYMLSVTNEDLDRTVNYCRIFTELSESLVTTMINKSLGANCHPHFTIKALDLVILCANHHDYEVLLITFNLWFRLSEELYKIHNDNLTELFKPYFEQLISALYKHCMIETDHEGLLDESVEEFADFRLKCSDLIKDVVFIVSSSAVFQQMYMLLQTASTSNVTWDQMEAALFIMQAIARNILPDENEVVPKVVEAILNMPDTVHINMRYTSVMLLGELCEWISHESHSESLEPILNYLQYCLRQQNLAAITAKSLHNICTTCRHHMVKHLSGLIEILKVVDMLNLPNDVAIGLLKGVSVIVAEVPEEHVYKAIKEICWRQLNPLLTLVESTTEKTVPETNTPSDPIYWLDRLSAVLRHLVTKTHSEKDPCVVAVVEMWPSMSKICNRYKTDFRITEHFCRCLRFMIRLVSRSTIALLAPIAEQMAFLYKEYHHSCYLYIGSILVDEYGSKFDNPLVMTQCHSILLEMIDAFIEPAFRLFSEKDGLRNYPDTVDDFFRLACRFIQKLPMPFLQSPVLESVIRCSIMAVSLDHKEANASVMKFLLDLLICGKSKKDSSNYEERKQYVTTIVNSIGEQLVENLIQASVFSLQTYMLPDVIDVIVELIAYDKDHTLQWLNRAVEKLPKQNSAGLVTATNEQCLQFLNSFHNYENEGELCRTLREFSRYFR
ncbi:transportin-3 [Daktulosphaira vitifoliae]|uniref:transportin-3 n=1 Tax=Daktulosphaira vitifoliae TaxID=58002 RepID=UPI0021A9E74D|nr:transportin-3 [Daktulosphaira vitifoliae]